MGIISGNLSQMVFFENLKRKWRHIFPKSKNLDFFVRWKIVEGVRLGLYVEYECSIINNHVTRAKFDVKISFRILAVVCFQVILIMIEFYTVIQLYYIVPDIFAFTLSFWDSRSAAQLWRALKPQKDYYNTQKASNHWLYIWFGVASECWSHTNHMAVYISIFD